MKKITGLLFLSFLLPVLSIAQSLDFETLTSPVHMPLGWTASPADGVFADKNIKRTGEYSLFMDGSKAVRVYTYTKGNLLYAGDTVCLKGFIRADRLAGHIKVIFSLAGDAQEEGSHIIAGCFIADADTRNNWREFELKLVSIYNFTVSLFFNAGLNVQIYQFTDLPMKNAISSVHW